MSEHPPYRGIRRHRWVKERVGHSSNPLERAGELELYRVLHVVDLPPAQSTQEALAEQRPAPGCANGGQDILHRSIADLQGLQPAHPLLEAAAVGQREA